MAKSGTKVKKSTKAKSSLKSARNAASANKANAITAKKKRFVGKAVTAKVKSQSRPAGTKTAAKVIKKSVLQKKAVKKQVNKKRSPKVVSKPLKKSAIEKRKTSIAEKPAAKQVNKEKVITQKKTAASSVITAPSKSHRTASKRDQPRYPVISPERRKAIVSSSIRKPRIHNADIFAEAKKKLKRPSKKTKYTVAELKQFRKIIVDEMKQILESARANMEALVDNESGEYKGDNLTYATHMAEQGTDEMEREKNYMFVQRDEKYLGYLHDALSRIDQGTYGICIDCKDDPKLLCKTCPLIPKERLEVVPITTHCIECKNIRS